MKSVIRRLWSGGLVACWALPRWLPIVQADGAAIVPRVPAVASLIKHGNLRLSLGGNLADVGKSVVIHCNLDAR